MSVVLDLRPEVEAKALAEAAAQGIRLEELLQTIVEVALQTPRSAPGISLSEFDQIMDDFAAGSDELPVPPIFDRAAIYGDHD